LAGGSVAVVATDDRCDEISLALDEAGVEHGRAAAGLGKGITVVPVSVVKGLELDGVVVVEPADIVESSDRGLRSLFVALTRSTKRLSVVHSRPLPQSMVDATPSSN
jgi:DNA helicase IV